MSPITLQLLNPAEHAMRCSETRDWIEGDGDVQMPGFLNGRQAVVWARNYSAENEERCDCNMLQSALSMVPGAKRMV